VGVQFFGPGFPLEFIPDLIGDGNERIML